MNDENGKQNGNAEAIGTVFDRLREKWAAAPPEIAQERERREAEAAERAAARIATERRERVLGFLAAVGARYRDATLDSFIVEHEAQRPVVEAIRAYARRGRDNIREGRGIVLFGPPGTGKDHLLVALGRLAAGSGFTIRWVNGAELFRELRDAISEDAKESRVLGRYARPHVLILSDPVPPGGRLSEYQSTMLYQLVDERYRALLPTWVSINVANGEEAGERLGAATVDRLRHGSLCLFCDWPSYRRAGFLEKTA